MIKEYQAKVKANILYRINQALIDKFSGYSKPKVRTKHCLKACANIKTVVSKPKQGIQVNSYAKQIIASEVTMIDIFKHYRLTGGRLEQTHRGGRNKAPAKL
jgi:transposase